MTDASAIPQPVESGGVEGPTSSPARLWRVTVVLLVVQALLAGTFGVTQVLANRQRPNAADANETLPAAPGPYTIETGFEGVRQQAELSAAGAELIAVGMQVDWPRNGSVEPTTSVPAGGWLTYVFVAPSEGFGADSAAVALTLFVERTTGVIYDQRVIDWPEVDREPLPIATYPISSSTAIVASELAAGTEHRRGCPQFRNETRVGLAGDGVASFASWVVTYPDSRYGESGLMVTIDATTGDITSVEDRSFPCEPE